MLGDFVHLYEKDNSCKEHSLVGDIKKSVCNYFWKPQDTCTRTLHAHTPTLSRNTWAFGGWPVPPVHTTGF